MIPDDLEFSHLFFTRDDSTGGIISEWVGDSPYIKASQEFLFSVNSITPETLVTGAVLSINNYDYTFEVVAIDDIGIVLLKRISPPIS